MTFHIGIIGCGPAGLTTALALEKATTPEQARITIVDRYSDATDYPGVEYGIQKRASRALERLGVFEASLGEGNNASRMMFYNMRKNRMQFSVPVDRRYTVDVLRQPFLASLGALLRRTEVLRRHNVVSFESLPEKRVRLNLEVGDEKAARSLDFDCLIACDGVNSIVRKALFPDAVIKDQGFDALYMLVDANAAGADAPPSVLKIANGSGVQFTLGTITTNCFFPQGKNRVTFAFGYDRPTRERLWPAYGLQPDIPWSLVEPDIKKSIARKLADDTPVYGGVFSKALDLIPDWNSPQIYQWIMRDSDPIEKPYTREANILLLGDSAHAFLPTIGMGASLAIEDAEILGGRLGQYLARGGQDVGDAMCERVFAPFARDRFPVWDDLIARARAAGENFKRQETLTRFAIAPYVPGKVLAKAFAAYEAVVGV